MVSLWAHVAQAAVIVGTLVRLCTSWCTIGGAYIRPAKGSGVDIIH